MKAGALRFLAAAVPAAVLAAVVVGHGAAQQASRELRPVDAFAGIADARERSVALFTEAGKVLTHARCVNCHPAGDRPLQGKAMQLHQPLVVRGADGHGAPGMRCDTCHGAANFDPGRVPGNPMWHLAPAEMAWQGKSLGEICEQVKDRARNGGKSMADLVHHMAEDSLVGWAWSPHAGRAPAPGTQAQFGALIKAWSEAGAACPSG
jgi:hypothetical protein